MFVCAIDSEYWSLCNFFSKGEGRAPSPHIITRNSNERIRKYLPNIDIVIAKTGPGNVLASAELTALIIKYKPTAVFFIGCCGGRKDVKIGDVVFVNTVYYTESKKVAVDLEKARPLAQGPRNDWINIAKRMETENQFDISSYSNQPYEGIANANVCVGAAASGEVVLTSTTSEETKYLDSHLDDTLIIEMEGHGFITACNKLNVPCLLVRGVSDTLENKSNADGAGWQHKATSNALAALVCMIDKNEIIKEHIYKNSKYDLDEKSHQTIDIDQLIADLRKVWDMFPTSSTRNALTDCFSELHSRLNKQVSFDRIDRSTSITTHTGEYRAILPALIGGDPTSVNAIADLTDETEEFWEELAPAKLSVEKRIFSISLKDIFDDERFSNLHFKVFGKHLPEYQVKVCIQLPTQTNHPFGESAIGSHLLIVRDEIIAGYDYCNNNKMLRITDSGEIVKEAQRFFAEQDERSVEVRSYSIAEDLRKEILDKSNGGIWELEWDKNKFRNARYCRKYPLNIRCWIPKYDRLVSSIVSVVNFEALKLTNITGAPIRVLEIGCGNGELSTQLFSDFKSINWKNRNIKDRRRIEAFVCSDASYPMIDICKSRFENSFTQDSINVILERAEAFSSDSFGIVLSRGPYDLVIMSLVLHDLIDLDEGGADLVLRSLSRLMSDRGVCVLMDIFPLSDQKVRKENAEVSEILLKDHEISRWKDWMKGYIGLKDGNVSQFFESNPEMVYGLSISNFEEIAERNNFDVEWVEIEGNEIEGTQSPFRLMTLRKRL